MSIMTVYHGGYRSVESPKINKRRFAKDLKFVGSEVVNV